MSPLGPPCQRWPTYRWVLGGPSVSLGQSVVAMHKGTSCPGLFSQEGLWEGAWLLGRAAPEQPQGMLISPSQSGLKDPVTSGYKETSPEAGHVRAGGVWTLKLQGQRLEQISTPGRRIHGACPRKQSLCLPRGTWEQVAGGSVDQGCHQSQCREA